MYYRLAPAKPDALGAPSGMLEFVHEAFSACLEHLARLAEIDCFYAEKTSKRHRELIAKGSVPRNQTNESLVAGVLASGGEDGRVCVWDIAKSAAPAGETLPPNSQVPPQLLFQHMGHRAQVMLCFKSLSL